MASLGVSTCCCNPVKDSSKPGCSVHFANNATIIREGCFYPQVPAHLVSFSLWIETFNIKSHLATEKCGPKDGRICLRHGSRDFGNDQQSWKDSQSYISKTCLALRSKLLQKIPSSNPSVSNQNKFLFHSFFNLSQYFPLTLHLTVIPASRRDASTCRPLEWSDSCKLCNDAWDAQALKKHGPIRSPQLSMVLRGGFNPQK